MCGTEEPFAQAGTVADVKYQFHKPGDTGANRVYQEDIAGKTLRACARSGRLTYSLHVFKERDGARKPDQHV